MLESLTETKLEPEIPNCGHFCEDYMREARLLQSSLIPAGPLRDQFVEIAFRFTPFFQVGGDFVDFFYMPNGMIGLYIGDVVGKGLPACMYGALVMGALRGIHKTGSDTANVLAMLNERLMQRPLQGRFCSTLYAVFDPSRRTLAFSNAGLPFPLQASATRCLVLGEGGLPSGLLPAATYNHELVQLSAGDTILFATDGLYESRNPQGVEFSSGDMHQVWSQCQSKTAEESLDFLFSALHIFSHGTTPHDDITAVVLKVLA
jgi:sigma-B regulation protein RsbU (phosphoserine phosphatase)